MTDRIYDNTRKYRPSFKCLFVIADLNGCLSNLEVILNRITPLRKMKNQEDMIIFLGNYIGNNSQSPNVIDILINLKSQYGDRVICLRGKNEQKLIDALNGSQDDYYSWLKIEGAQIINPYLISREIKQSPYAIAQERFKNIIGEDHINFLNSLPFYQVLDNYCFFNGSFDPKKRLEDNLNLNFVFDSTGASYVKNCVKLKINPVFIEDYIFIGVENPRGKNPYIHSKYFMLGSNDPNRTFLLELNSMLISCVKRGKSRLYKHNFKYYD